MLYVIRAATSNLQQLFERLRAIAVKYTIIRCSCNVSPRTNLKDIRKAGLKSAHQHAHIPTSLNSIPKRLAQCERRGLLIPNRSSQVKKPACFAQCVFLYTS